MKIVVANKDRTADLGAEIQQAARVRKQGRAPDEIAPEISALSLARAKSDAEYLDHLVRLIRYRDAVDTLDFDIPRKPGLVGVIMARVKALLWKLLRYQHDRIAFRQNLINGLFTHALESEIALRKRAVDELDQRLARLESRMSSSASSRSGLPAEKPS